MATRQAQELLGDILTLRVLVGYLGETKQHHWWDCGFLDATGRRFLETTFPRSAWAAAIHSSSEAARLVHDAAVGRRGSYHLFRLPSDLEDKVEVLIAADDAAHRSEDLASGAAALAALEGMAETKIKAPEGPIQVGVSTKIISKGAVSEMAAHYYSGFHQTVRCFPYFAAGANAR